MSKLKHTTRSNVHVGYAKQFTVILVGKTFNSILAILGLWHNEKHNLDMQTYRPKASLQLL
jgi:hypothetical protein